eukprot:1157093-Pelagomonas_calceolata.AAC.1
MRARPELLPRLNGWLPGGDIYDLMVGMGIGFVDNNQMLCAFSMRNRGTQPTMFTPGTTGGLFFSSFSWFIRWQRQQLVHSKQSLAGVLHALAHIVKVASQKAACIKERLPN